MGGHIRRHATYANVVATMALLFAMSGGALAAGHYLITSTKQISPKVRKALKGNVGPRGLTGSTGPSGPEGKQGLIGPEGHEGKQGTSAPTLWASVLVNEITGTPSITAGTGVTSVTRPHTGEALVTFDQDVTNCSFQATLVGPGGGYYTPPNEISVFTGFYSGSGLSNQQVMVTTLHNKEPNSAYSFSIAAIC